MAKSEVAGRKKKFGLFDAINYLVFIIVALIVVLPIWKVVVDSFNAVGVYKFLLWPTEPTLGNHKDLRNALIETGIQIVSTEGVNAFSLRKVAAACGVSHAAPYSHFQK